MTDEQVARFGCFDAVRSQAELERLFFLDDADRVMVGRHCGGHNRLGFALHARPSVDALERWHAERDPAARKASRR